ncbi:hypothetical protein [Parasitella parasitica]|uniref:Uncharacterized protein n=1 Tax=Parasitella parasitica TaxID=35722 RepID=A0A0B7NRF7_9FUNG|nr:hypothetical protein [Parasitella parasitica]
MGLDSTVFGAPKNYDLYSNELTLVELVSSYPQEIKELNQLNRRQKGGDEVSIPIVEDGLKILFQNESKKQKYTYEQVQQLLCLILVSKMIGNQASQICEINPSNGYGYVKQIKDAQNIKKTAVTVDKKDVHKKPGNRKLFEKHYKFLAQLFQDDEFSTSLKSACNEMAPI